MDSKPKLIVHAMAEERVKYLNRHLVNLDTCVLTMKEVPWWKLYKFLKYRLAILSVTMCIRPKLQKLILDYTIYTANPPDFTIGYINMRFIEFLETHKKFLINLNKLYLVKEDKFLEKLNK